MYLVEQFTSYWAFRGFQLFIVISKLRMTEPNAQLEHSHKENTFNEKNEHCIIVIVQFFHFLKSFLSLLYWGYTVIFTKVITIYHGGINPLHYSPLSLIPAFM
jgi:hypothetical protein